MSEETKCPCAQCEVLDRRELDALFKAYPLPWRAYKAWIFDANNNHVLYERANLSANEAEKIVYAVNSRIALKQERDRYKAALEKIRSTNGLQYSDFFKICDEALKYRGD